ncbi:hypothetical protein [Calidifontibacter terrae]
MSDLEKRLRDALAAKADAIDTTPSSPEKEAEFLSQLHRPEQRKRGAWWLGGGVAAAACGVVALALVHAPSHPNNASTAGGTALASAAGGPNTARSTPTGATPGSGGDQMTGMAQPGRSNSTEAFTVPGATVFGPSQVSVTVDGQPLVFRPVLSLLRGRLTVAGELHGPAYAPSPAMTFPYAWSVMTPGGGFVEDAAAGCAKVTKQEINDTRTFGGWTLRGSGTVTISTSVCTAVGKPRELRWSGKVVPRPYG